MKNSLWIFAGIVLLGAIAGGYIYPKVSLLSGTASGTAFTRKISEFSFNPTDSTGTTTISAINGDGADRFVTSVETVCSNVGTSLTAFTGTGLAALKFSLATSSGSGANLANTNYVYNGTIATSSTTFYDASSTPGLAPAATVGNRRWAAGSYMMISSNATNTSNCIIDINYLQGLGV